MNLCPLILEKSFFWLMHGGEALKSQVLLAQGRNGKHLRGVKRSGNAAVVLCCCQARDGKEEC